MRHGVKVKKLGRNHSHRKALIKNMIKSFVKSEKMITTVEKAKALKPYLEKMLTIAKVDTMANRRLLFSRLDSKATIDKLFEDIAPRYKDRQGGYTRILKLYNRRGDNATMALMELVEEELSVKAKKTTKKKVSTTSSNKKDSIVQELSNNSSLEASENEKI